MLGVAGVAGNGQRELAEAVTGMRPISAGIVRVGGTDLAAGDPRAAITAGIAHVPEDRMHTGVATEPQHRLEHRHSSRIAPTFRRGRFSGSGESATAPSR